MMPRDFHSPDQIEGLTERRIQEVRKPKSKRDWGILVFGSILIIAALILLGVWW